MQCRDFYFLGSKNRFTKKRKKEKNSSVKFMSLMNAVVQPAREESDGGLFMFGICFRKRVSGRRKTQFG